MALVVYQCDTCNRIIEKKQNKQGLEVVNNCIITDGCKGKLNFVSLKRAHSIPSITPPEQNLTDWIQRKVLHTHDQTLLSPAWEITHNLGTRPSVEVFVRLGSDDTLTEIEPVSITVQSDDVLTINLDLPYRGTAQLISRGSSEGQQITTLTPTIEQQATLIQLSTTQELTIATLFSSDLPGEDYVDLDICFLDPSTFAETQISTLRFDDVNLVQSPWADKTSVLIKGQVYTIRSATISLTELINLGIQDASPFYVKNIYYGSTPVSELGKNELFVLLTNSPFQSFDKNLKETLDVSLLNRDNASTNTNLLSNELFVNSNLIEDLFPTITAL